MLADGRAAIQLMGTWEYQYRLSRHPEFAREDLGWTVFPRVRATGGSPDTVVCPPSNYLSVRKDSPRSAQAVDFLLSTSTSRSHPQDLIAIGAVPAVRKAEKVFGGTQSEGFVSYVLPTVSAAPAFAPPWDQMLPPATGDQLNGLPQKLFLLRMAPEQFVAAVEKTRGEETPDGPRSPVPGPGCRSPRHRERAAVPAHGRRRTRRRGSPG